MTAWADLAGVAWWQLEQAPGNREPLNRLLWEGLERCTPLERDTLSRYYASGQIMADIASDRGVDRSSVGKTIHRGLEKTGRYLFCRLSVPACRVGERFDYLKFCRSTGLLSRRETELLYLWLAPDASRARIARTLGLQWTTVDRGVRRASRRLESVRVPVCRALDSCPDPLQDRAAGGEAAIRQRVEQGETVPPGRVLAALRTLAAGGDLPLEVSAPC